MEFYSDSIHKIAYATDASAYRQIPQAVAYPECKEDIRSLIDTARKRGCCLIPRAGGTSIAGQVVGDGIVVDVSRHMNRILEINTAERWVRVEPGVVRDELNLALKPHGLFFSPETSTSNRCCIGGMTGNNSCGTHSLVYGATRDHVLEVKGFLSDGSEFSSSSREGSPLLDKIYSQLEGWKNDPETIRIIEENFPDRTLRRRSCGYAIDEALENLDLCKLIAGSEGTLAFLYEIKLSLDPLPPVENMVLCAHCDSLEKSFEANLLALKHSPVAVELMDGKILELGKDNPSAQRNRFFVQGDPAALIIAEFNGDEMNTNADALEEELRSTGLAYSCTRVYGKDVNRVWALRKAGLGVLSGMKGDAKPIGVIEDTAVAPERMSAYMADFRAMLSELGLDCVYYGHISTGELHLRPIINIKTADGRRLFREVAQQTALLVKKHRGSLSGEHGDGRLRGEFIPLMYGQQCYEMMRSLKHLWDPDGVFNTGKIVDTPPMDEDLRFELDRQYALLNEMKKNDTVFNWKAAFDECKVEGASGVSDQVHALMCSVEQCNGAGDCRKSSQIGGTLCPAFKVSDRDELQSTRARANLLREILTNGADGEVLKSPLLREVLYSCLACKGCRGECPSNVDMTRIRAEILQQIYRKKGVPFRSWMVSRMAKVESLGSHFVPLYNFAASFKPSAAIIKKMVGFSPQRSIPIISNEKIEGTSVQKPRKVYLFLDEFTRHQEPQLAKTLIALLEHLGYAVEIPKHCESGRAAISKGCLTYASRFAKKNFKTFQPIVSEDTPLIGIEPSCILSFRDEYPDLVDAEDRSKAIELGRNCLLFDEFFVREMDAGRISADSFKNDYVEIWLHGHCHQKALVGTAAMEKMLHILPGAKVNVIPSGCCGMAGSFGYEKEHYRTSLEIGEMILFPAVRKAVRGAVPAIVAAPGTSCRQQILDGTGVRAVHPIEILNKFLK